MVKVDVYPQALSSSTLALMRAWLIHQGHRENATSWVALDNIGPLLVLGNTESQWETPTYLPEWATTKVLLNHQQWEQALLAENKATDRSSLLENIKLAPSLLPEFEDTAEAVRFLVEYCPCETAIAEQAAMCLRNRTKDFPSQLHQAATILMSNHQFVNLNVFAISDALRSLIPADIIAGYGVIAFSCENDTIHVATKSPDRIVTDKIRSRTGMEVVQYIAPASSIDDAISRTSDYAIQFQQSSNDPSVRSVALTINPSDVHADISETLDGQVLLSYIIAQSIIQRANDIHIQPQSANRTLVRIRVDRDLRIIAVLNAEQSERVFGRIKSVAEMKSGMHLQMDDASMTVMYNSEEYDR